MLYIITLRVNKKTQNSRPYLRQIFADFNFFYPRHAIAWAGNAIVCCGSVSPSVCPSVRCDADIRWS